MLKWLAEIKRKKYGCQTRKIWLVKMWKYKCGCQMHSTCTYYCWAKSLWAFVFNFLIYVFLIKFDIMSCWKWMWSFLVYSPLTSEMQNDNLNQIVLQVVLLTRTDRAGNVRPLVDTSEASSGGNSKKRRKKKVVQTHGDKGERKRYFHDDDKYDVKSLVDLLSAISDDQYIIQLHVLYVNSKEEESYFWIYKVCLSTCIVI